MAAIADALAGELDTSNAHVDGQQRLRGELARKLPHLEAQLEALNRYAEPGTANDPANEPSIARELAETRQTLAEIEGEIERATKAQQQPRADRRAILAMIDKLVEALGTDGARLREQMRGLAP
ncbi:MAG: hypothetical protein GEV05_28305 [Betaproteobacteria bacterium]|nr:hypothetical protein [Betaproteobacteria bacterium]